jgi:alkylated DNA repair dioxygenase AlkB
MSIAQHVQATEAHTPSTFIDLEHYPLTAPDSSGYQEVVEDSRAQLSLHAILALPGFLNPHGLRLLLENAHQLDPKAYHAVKKSNPYRVQVTDDMDERHPARILSSTARHGVAYHDMGGTAMEALYRWPPLRRFVADVLGLPKVYLHEDPSNALVLQIYKPGDHLAWHFDRANFSITLQLQKADEGGYFEAAPAIRDEEEENHEGVRALLCEEHEAPFKKRSEPGTLAILYGRNCLHRVTKVVGDRARISLILSYEEEPGLRLDPETRKLFFGPDAPDDPC